MLTYLEICFELGVGGSCRWFVAEQHERFQANEDYGKRSTIEIQTHKIMIIWFVFFAKKCFPFFSLAWRQRQHSPLPP